MERDLYNFMLGEQQEMVRCGMYHPVVVDLPEWPHELELPTRRLKGVLGSLVKKEIIMLQEDYWDDGDRVVIFDVDLYSINTLSPID